MVCQMEGRPSTPILPLLPNRQNARVQPAATPTTTNPFLKAFQQTLLLQHQTPSALIQEETQHSQQWFLSSMQQAVCKQHSLSSTKCSHGRSGWQEESSIKHAKLKRKLWLHNESELQANLHEIPTAKVASTAAFGIHNAHSLQHFPPAVARFGTRRYRQLPWGCYLERQRDMASMCDSTSGGRSGTLSQVLRCYCSVDTPIGNF